MKTMSRNQRNSVNDFWLYRLLDGGSSTDRVLLTSTRTRTRTYIYTSKFVDI